MRFQPTKSSGIFLAVALIWVFLGLDRLDLFSLHAHPPGKFAPWFAAADFMIAALSGARAVQLAMKSGRKV
jgi:hypothetical protein